MPSLTHIERISWRSIRFESATGPSVRIESKGEGLIRYSIASNRMWSFPFNRTGHIIFAIESNGPKLKPYITHILPIYLYHTV
ncbi:FAD-binding monooxygenase moxY [Fusarium oxysporum f. sp. albedinis]|nr:FAD-binding monooxygenase moxY [Fusarium oxysporum f. sp. albedinis]